MNDMRVGSLYRTASWNGKGFIEVFETFDDAFGYRRTGARTENGEPVILLQQVNTEFGDFSKVLLRHGPMWVLSVNLEDA
jgi:hypothetical protein